MEQIGFMPDNLRVNTIEKSPYYTGFFLLYEPPLLSLWWEGKGIAIAKIIEKRPPLI